MKKLHRSFFPVLFILFLLNACSEPEKPKDLYNEMFNWGINIPAEFEKVSSEEWDVIKNRGAEVIENSFGETPEDQTKTIFVFKQGDLNYMESNYQPYNKNVDGDYLANCKEVNQVLYQTFETQMPEASLDSASFTEEISGLNFNVFNVNIAFTETMKLKSYMYSRLFDNQEFTVNIMYVDAAAGEKMLETWKNSSFN